MKPQNLHAQEDRLLDFVYGELPPLEARAVESHLEGCERCSELLAGIRGVRSTMSQLSMEPAPDAGLESLLAYAQQAARNAAAGPAPKPTWWRRWLVPVAGVAAVTVFGIVTIQVSKEVDLSPELAKQSAESTAAAPAAPSEMRAPAPMQPPASTPPVAQAAPSPEPEAAQLGQSNAYEGATPPPPAPAAKLDDSVYAKEASRKKAFVSGTKGGSADWSNAGAGAGFERSKAAEDTELAATETTSEKKAKSYTYDRRDAMTQGPAFPKSKPVLVGSAQGGAASPVATPAPAEAPATAAAQPTMEESPAADGLVAEGEAQVQQEAPSRGSLRITKSKAPANKPARASAGSADEGDFDDMFGDAKTSTAKREQRAPSAMPPPPPTASAAPMPSVGSTRAPSMPSGRSESKDNAYGPSSSELSKLADAAFRSGDRVREAQLLRQALDAGATGKERLGLLNRLCDAEFAIGRRQEAFAVCNQLIDEEPGSSAAQVARRRLSREAAETDDAKPGSRGPAKAAPVDKMEAPASAPVKQ